MAVSIPGMAEGGTKGGGVGIMAGLMALISVLLPRAKPQRSFLSHWPGSWLTLLLKKFPGMCE